MVRSAKAVGMMLLVALSACSAAETSAPRDQVSELLAPEAIPRSSPWRLEETQDPMNDAVVTRSLALFDDGVVTSEVLVSCEVQNNRPSPGSLRVSMRTFASSAATATNALQPAPLQDAVMVRLDDTQAHQLLKLAGYANEITHTYLDIAPAIGEGYGLANRTQNFRWAYDRLLVKAVAIANGAAHETLVQIDLNDPAVVRTAEACGWSEAPSARDDASELPVIPAGGAFEDYISVLSVAGFAQTPIRRCNNRVCVHTFTRTADGRQAYVHTELDDVRVLDVEWAD